jgi:hypothetical protein
MTSRPGMTSAPRFVENAVPLGGLSANLATKSPPAGGELGGLPQLIHLNRIHEHGALTDTEEVTGRIQNRAPPTRALVGGGSCQARRRACLIRPLSAGRFGGFVEPYLSRRWIGLGAHTDICDLVIMIMGQLASFGLPWWRRAGRQTRSGVTPKGCPP